MNRLAGQRVESLAVAALPLATQTRCTLRVHAGLEYTCTSWYETQQQGTLNRGGWPVSHAGLSNLGLFFFAHLIRDFLPFF